MSNDVDQPVSSAVLTRIADELASFHLRAAHREAVIDRLHEENQVLRRGMGRELLEPIVVDLVRLFDGLSRQSERGGAEAALFGSFADDVLLMLERCGIDEFTAEPGSPFTVGRHECVERVECTDPDVHHTLAEVVRVGLRDRESGVVRRPLQARIFDLTTTGSAPSGPVDDMTK